MNSRLFVAVAALLSLLATGAYTAGPDSPAGYLVIADISVHDEDTYERYRSQVKPIIEMYGGRYIVRAGAKFVTDDASTKLLSADGGWNPDRLIVLRFDSMEAIEKTFSSPEYEAIVDLRLSSSTGRTIIVEALE